MERVKKDFQDHRECAERSIHEAVEMIAVEV